jgi:hypothetical protein
MIGDVADTVHIGNRKRAFGSCANTKNTKKPEAQAKGSGLDRRAVNDLLACASGFLKRGTDRANATSRLALRASSVVGTEH